MSATTTKARATRNATTALAKANGKLTTLPSVKDNVIFEANGCTFVVSAVMHDGRQRTGGSAVACHPRGADKPSVKSLTSQQLTALMSITTDVKIALERLDKQFSLGAHAPVKAPRAAADTVDVALVQAETRAEMLASLANALGMPSEQLEALVS